MATEWRNVKFSELCSISRGASPRPIHDWIVDEGIPWVKIADATSAGSRYIGRTNEFIRTEGKAKSVAVFPGDLILTNSATPGIPMFMGIEACIHDGWMLLRNFKGLDKLFAYYLLLHERPALVQQGNGSVFTNLKTDILKNHKVKIPDIQEQRAIARILGTLDDKIELNRKQNETLEAMARALFKAWFVDFEPVRTKMEGRWQRGQSLPGLPAHLYDIFPDHLVDSELGEIPEGWRMGSLGEVAVHPRRSVQPNEIKDGTPYIALEHMPKRCTALAEWGVANGLESNKHEFKQGEILFGKLRPYFHKVGVAPVNGVCSTDIVVIAPKLPIWFGFVLAHVSSDAFVEYTNAGSTGTKMPRTNWTEMARYLIVLPHESVAAAFNHHIQAASEEIIAKIHESKSLAQLRDTLLPKLISGELRVPDAERIHGEAKKA
ncbi:restriction endonuclease subunit S [Castellaniella sp.]|uniref:restriction endonuclease subunit S n=1 Tax=Castellaniella sp. TaxID=1955812 RepID=UPI0035637526